MPKISKYKLERSYLEKIKKIKGMSEEERKRFIIERFPKAFFKVHVEPYMKYLRNDTNEIIRKEIDKFPPQDRVEAKSKICEMIRENIMNVIKNRDESFIFDMVDEQCGEILEEMRKCVDFCSKLLGINDESFKEEVVREIMKEITQRVCEEIIKELNKIEYD